MNYTIVVCHMNPAVIDEGLKRYYETATEESQLVLLNHHYPMDYWGTSHKILDLAEKYKGRVISNYKNVGGHDGFSWALKQLPLEQEDIIIGYDGDTNPLTPGWDKAAITVMKEGNLVGVHLMHEHILQRQWQIKTYASGIRIATLPHAEMFNATVWKASFLMATNGLQGGFPYYGGVEVSILAKAAAMGLSMGYLYDFRETLGTVGHDAEYNAWKAAHVGGFKGNFDSYLKLNR